MRPRVLRRRLAMIGIGAVLAGTALSFTPEADAAPANCENIGWGFLWSQTRSICDGPILADGSWERHRLIWVPAHQVPFRCTYSSYSSSCSGGYFVDDREVDYDEYMVNPGNVLPDEPGHLG